jgi:hypothetical protein
MKDECMPGAGGSQFDWCRCAAGFAIISLEDLLLVLTAKKRLLFEPPGKPDRRAPR